MITSALAAFLLFLAAKDPSKIFGAWLILLIDLILSLAGVIVILTGNGDSHYIIPTVVAAVLNVLVFGAAQKVRKTVKNR